MSSKRPLQTTIQPIPPLPTSKLPINAYKSKIQSTLLTSRTLILTSSTGSGKTTHVPFYASEMYPKSRISVTQPRRVACTSVATYVSNLLSVELGTSVGYSVRFDHKCSPSTLVTFQTDGMLLRECTSGSKGRAFGNYDVVVVDEVRLAGAKRQSKASISSLHPLPVNNHVLFIASLLTPLIAGPREERRK